MAIETLTGEVLAMEIFSVDQNQIGIRSDTNATMLVNEWCRRMQWILEEERVKSSAGAPTPYVVPEVFQNWYSKLPAKSEARRSADNLVRHWDQFV